MVNLYDELDDEGNFKTGIKTCNLKRLVLYTTQRFNYFLREPKDPDHIVYYSMLKRMDKQKQKKIFWVGNNPSEQIFADFKMGGEYLQVLKID